MTFAQEQWATRSRLLGVSMSRRMAALAAFLVVMQGCSGESTQSNALESSGGRVYQSLQESRPLKLREELRFGEAGDSGLAFFVIRGVVQGASRTIYVLDAGNHRVAVVDPQGRLIKSIGRHGDGPGEFVGALHVSFARDTLVVTDNGNRVHFFSADGELIRTRVYSDLAVSGDGWHVSEVDGVPGGWLLTAVAYFGRKAEGGEASPAPRFRIRTFWVGKSGDLSETALRWEQPSPGVWSGLFWVQAPYAYRPAWAVDGLGRLVAADSAVYTLAILDEHGARLRTIINEVTKVPVDGAALDRWRDAFKCRPGRECAPGGTELALSLPRPEFLQAVGAISGFTGGYFAVRRADTDPNMFDSTVEGSWDFFDPSGRYLGSVPSGQMTPRWFDGQTLLTTQRAETDEQYVVRYRLEGEGSE